MPPTFRPFRNKARALLAGAILASAIVGPATVDAAEPVRPQAFPSASWWNTPLPANAPRHSNSDAIIAFLKADNVSNGCPLLSGAGTNAWGMPIYWASSTDKAYNVTSSKYAVPPEFASLRIPAGAKPMATADGEMVVYDLSRGIVAEVYNSVYNAATDTWTAGGGSVAYLDSNGIDGRFPQSDERRNTGGFRGYNGAVAAIRHDEVTSGRVNHVLKVGVNTSHSGFQFPMWGSDGTTTSPAAPIQGAQIRIKPGVDLTAYGLHPQALPIAKALQSHGMMVGDSTGNPVELKLEDTAREGRGQLWQIPSNALCGIPLDAYEVIDYGYTKPIGATTTPTAPPATTPTTVAPTTTTTRPVTTTTVPVTTTTTRPVTTPTTVPVTTPTTVPAPPTTAVPAPSGSGIKWEGSSAAVSTATGTLTIPKPSSVRAGHVMIASIDVRGRPAITAPAGWRVLRHDRLDYTMMKVTYVRVAGLSEPASSTWSFSSGLAAAAGGITAYSGVDPVNPVLTHSGWLSGATRTATVTAPSVTTTKAPLVVALFGQANGSSTTAPAGMVERWDVANRATYMVTSAASDRLLTASGATGSYTATMSSAGSGIGQLIALAPLG